MSSKMQKKVLLFLLQLAHQIDLQLSDLRSIRITYPIYKDRTPYFDQAELRYSDTLSSSLQLVEPVTAIARKCLSERMLWGVLSLTNSSCS